MDLATANRRALRAITESQWQKTVLDHARRAGWIVHFVPDRLYHEGRKHVTHAFDQGDRGYPDLTLVKGSRLLFRELKTESGKLSEHQEKWRDRLLAAGADWELWRPSDVDEVIAELWEDYPR